jgi:AmmeMemoRadiSam system protein A
VLNSDEQWRVLRLARRALEARVMRTARPRPETGGALDGRCGAFVSIHRARDLRGCLGRLGAEWTLGRTVVHLGARVADSDPRFPPVTVDELRALDIEVSVLTPEYAVEGVSAIEIGRHGLIVEDGARRGLLLPQVATEHGWDAEEFAAYTCLKAGLPADAWQRGARLRAFEAQVFGERC